MRRITVCIALFALAASASCAEKEESAGGESGGPKAGESGSNAGGETAQPGNEPAPKAEKKEAAPPPKEDFIGQGRLFNGLVWEDGKAETVDVWATRGFKHGPVLLAEGVKVGEYSDWFAAPKGQRIVFVKSGAGPDGEKIAGMSAPKEDEVITAILQLDRGGKTFAGNHWEAGKSSGVPEAPAAGKGLVVIRAYPLRAHEKTLDAKSWAFQVGDGKGACAEQRGGKKTILGGTNPVELELDPGKHTVTIHGRSDSKCAEEPVYTMEVEVVADQGTLAVLYTPDGKSIASASAPMKLGASQPDETK